MEVDKPSRINIDFEFELFDSKYEEKKLFYQKIVNEFEYVCFFFKDCPLFIYSSVDYPEKYKSYLESLGIKWPVFVNKGSDTLNWWGDTLNPELERKLNSKTYIFKKFSEFFPPKTFLTKNYEEIKRKIKGSWIAKSEGGVSGKGNIRFNEDFNNELEIKELLTQGELLMSPFLEGKVLSYRPNTFCRQALYSSKGSLKHIFMGEYKPRNLEHLEKLFNEIKGSYSIESIQFDCIETDSKVYLLEANHRRTMGDFSYELERFKPKDGVGGIFFIPQSRCSNKKWTVSENILYSLKSKCGVILLSPKGRKMRSFAIFSKSKGEYFELMEALFLEIGLNPEYKAQLYEEIQSLTWT